MDLSLHGCALVSKEAYMVMAEYHFAQRSSRPRRRRATRDTGGDESPWLRRLVQDWTECSWWKSPWIKRLGVGGDWATLLPCM